MNESIGNEKVHRGTITPKLFGFPRTTAGVLIGIFIFLLVEAIFRITNLFTAFIILLSPGILTAWIMLPTLGWSTSIIAKLINYSVLFGVSSIPTGMLGALIISDKKETRLKGIIFSIIYIIALLIIGIPISTVFD
jgi:hypothetical protein